MLKTNIPVLIDFDGVIRLGKDLADDAQSFLNFLNENSIPFFILSNSTQTTGKDIQDFITASGIDFKINAMTTIDAVKNYLSKVRKKVKVYCKKNMIGHFDEFISDEKPDAVVIGDLGDEWSYEILNEIFRNVNDGAEIIAMQKNKFWKPDGKTLALDAGAFIAAIEYAASKRSLLIGKPSPLYFQTAIEMLGFKKDSKFIMIGDDIESDVNAAQQIGGTGILVFTGKTKHPLPANLPRQPDYGVKNLTEAISILKSF